jgi:hypothetical protein
LLTCKTVFLKSSNEVYEAGLGAVGVARTIVDASTVLVTYTTLSVLTTLTKLMSTRSQRNAECGVVAIVNDILGLPALMIQEN